MPRLALSLLTCAFALALAGCDRESAEPAQPEGAAVADTAAGTIDRAFAGQAMPELTLQDPGGSSLELASLKGKPVLVNLWATWCVPCVTEMPMLDELAGELGDSVTVLTVSEDMDGAAKVGPFFAEKQFKRLPQWLDPDNALTRAFGGVSLPLTVLFDAEGKEVWRVMGAYDWSGAEAREMIAEASAT